MEINYLAVLVCGILAMIIGGLWYGPLFGKTWMKTIGVNPDDKEAVKKMQKSAGPLYVIQFLLALMQIWILANYIQGWDEVSGIENALWLWLGFVMPTIAAASMWNNEPAKTSLTRFSIQAGYQLVCLVLFGLILGMWQ
jgi:hypothetical protein